MGKKTPTGKIEIVFDEKGRVSFDINVGMNSQLIIALMGLEGFLKSNTNLSTEDVRQLIDEEKDGIEKRIKPKIKDADVIDAELDDSEDHD